MLTLGYGGAPSSPEAMKMFFAKLPHKDVCKVIHGFGMTEAPTATAELSRTINCSGNLAPNTKAKIVDVETGHLVTEIGKQGELCLKGINVLSDRLLGTT